MAGKDEDERQPDERRRGEHGEFQLRQRQLQAAGRVVLEEVDERPQRAERQEAGEGHRAGPRPVPARDARNRGCESASHNEAVREDRHRCA